MCVKNYRAVMALVFSIAPLALAQRQDEFYVTRAYPLNAIPAGARVAAVAEMERMIAREKTLGSSSVTAAPVWTLIGPRPTNVLIEYSPSGNGGPYSAGRVTALAV